MNNLNLLSQKITYDSIVNKHLRSSQQPSESVRRSSKNPIYQPAISTSKERNSVSAAGSAKLSATLKQPANANINRYTQPSHTNYERESMNRTLEADGN